jgi:DNA-directed RNA polymerase subunit RPC12/RpoP
MLDVNLDFSDSPSDNFDDAASYISAVESLLSQEEVAGLLDEIERNDPSSATVMQSWIQTFGLDRLFPGLGAAEQPVASPQDLVGYASSSYASSSYAGSEVGDLDGEYDTDDASSTYTAGSASNPAAPPKKRRANGDGSGRPRKKGTPGGSHVCDECGKSFSRSFNLKMHKETHNENRDKNFPCPHCNMRFVGICDFNLFYWKLTFLLL